MLLRKPKSLGRYDTFTGIVTSQRMIFAQMTNEMLKNAIQASRDQAKAEGKGFWGQWEEQLRASFGYSQRYLTLDPSTALAETLGNFEVYNNAIKEVKLHVKDLSRGGQADIQEFEIEANSDQGKYQFRMDERDEYVNLLKRVYGERVKMPFGYFSHGIRVGF
jgi:predicted Zn-dependent peptidase